MSKSSKNTRNKIIQTSWNLFYSQGYENTTVDDIIEAAHISKGTFYHYFTGRDDLVGGIAYLLDEEYENIISSMDKNIKAINKLALLTKNSFFMLENTVPVNLLSKILSSHMNGNCGYKSLLNPDRTYYRVIRKLVIDAKQEGSINQNYSVNEVCIAYSLFERGLMYDWCISNGSYAFSEYAYKIMRIFLSGFANNPAQND